jgi:hypothetical protein
MTPALDLRWSWFSLIMREAAVLMKRGKSDHSHNDNALDGYDSIEYRVLVTLFHYF